MKPIPSRVVICGIGYRVQETGDQCIVFTEDQPVFGQATIAMVSKHCLCWYVEATPPRIMGNHVVEMVELACKWRGPNHTRYADLARTEGNHGK